MSTKPQKAKVMDTHVVDILGNVKGRDQPVMLLNEAIKLIQHLDKKTLSADGYVFFDPFCKAGEILLASAFVRQLVKNMKSKVGQKKVYKDMFLSNRFFALAPDERHYHLSLRTFLGNEKSHNTQYAKVIRNGNYLSEIDGRLNKKKFKQELKNMIDYIKTKAPNRKIIAVGNPPYQEADGGAKASAKPVYNYFVEALMDSGQVDEYVLVIPARWFSAGKGLDPFRKKMVSSKQIKAIHYFERSEDIFPTVHVQGGVCFIHWAKDYQGKADFIFKNEQVKIDLSRFDIIPDDPKSAPIIQKVLTSPKFISDKAWSRKPFGLATDYFKKNAESNPSASDSIKCYTKDKKIKYISRRKIKVNADKIDLWKVAIPRAYATGARRCTLPPHQIFLIEKGAVCTETYNVIDAFKSKQDAEKLIAYLKTDFARYLLGLRKLTQDIPRDRWNWVPYVDINRSWNDQKLFKYFTINKNEAKHILEKIKEW